MKKKTKKRKPRKETSNHNFTPSEYSEDELERQRGILRQQEVQGDDSFEGEQTHGGDCRCLGVNSSIVIDLLS